MTQAYVSLLDALSDFAAKYDFLDAEHLATSSSTELDEALHAFWVSRFIFETAIAAVCETAPTSDHEQVVRRGALVAYSALPNPEELIFATVRTLYPLVLPYSIVTHSSHQQGEQALSGKTDSMVCGPESEPGSCLIANCRVSRA